jgi:prepilin-type N-terminal cleavage/methylation domain-containing protein
MILFLKPKTFLPARTSVTAGKHKPTAGFTIIELLVVIALIAIVSTVTLVSLTGRKSRRTLDTATSQLAATLREAESRATAQSQGTTWGVHVDNTTTTSAFYALFSSSSYAKSYEVSRYRLPAGVFYTTTTIPAGQSKDIVFSQLTGTAASTTVGLMMAYGVGTSTLITIDTTGLISF